MPTEPGDIVGAGKTREKVEIEEMHRRLHEQLTAWRVPRTPPTGGGRLSVLARVRLMRNESLRIVHAQRYEIERLKRLLKEADVDPGA